jgi:IS605 OrfB family transposase
MEEEDPLAFIKEVIRESKKQEEEEDPLAFIKEVIRESKKQEEEEDPLAFIKEVIRESKKQEEFANKKGFLTEEDLSLKMSMDSFFESFHQDTANSQVDVFFAQKDIDTREETFEKKGYMLFTESVEFNKHFRFAPDFHSFTNRTAKLWNRANFPARSRYFFHHAPEKLDYKMLARAFYRSSVKDRFKGWLDFFENYKGYEKHYIDKVNQPKGKQGYYNAYNRNGDPTPRYEKELGSIDEIYTKEFRELERKELREQSYKISREKKDIDKRIVNRYLNYNNDFAKMMRVTDEYKALPSQTAQQTLMLLFQAWQGYWILKREFNLKREKYGLNSEECPPRPGLPRYKDSDGEFVGIIPTSGMFQIKKIKDGMVSRNSYTDHFINSLKVSKYKSHFSATAEIKLPKKTGLPPIRFRIPFFKNQSELNSFKDLTHKEQIQFLRDKIQQIRIVPKSWGYKAEMIYKVPLEELELEKKKARFDPNRAGAVDLGVNILAAIVNNFGENPILIKGNRVKDINFRANRFYSSLKSIIDFMKNENNLTWKRIDEIINALPPDLKVIVKFKRNTIKKSSDMIGELKKLQRQVAKKRYNRLENEFHRVANLIRDYFVEHRTGIVAIGRPKGWKKDIKKTIHKKALQRFNRKFQKIPFDNFLNRLWYKLAKEGIRVITGPEDYTSKCSFLDQEEIKKHKEYLGTRGPSMKGRGKGGVGTKYPKARGLFKSKKYGYIHSDVNGAFNIGRKLLPSYFSNIPRNKMKLSPIGKFKFDNSLYAVS